MLQATDVVVRFGQVTAVAGASLIVPDGPYGVGLVGESGSGKTTLARAILGLTPVASGELVVQGRDVTRLRARDIHDFRRAVQVVLQDSDGSLSPRMRVGEAITEVLAAHGIGTRQTRREKAISLLEEVGLSSEYASRLPHQLSGGQRQRVAMARALAVGPDLLVLDEPTSALDVTVQARILDLIEQLREDRNLAYLLISHNLAVVERLCEEVHVLYLGRVVENGPTAQVLANPAHPYTAALRSAVPQLRKDESTRRERIVLPGIPPDPVNPPAGCVFHPRCPIAIDICRTVVPERTTVAPGRTVACHRATEVLAGSVDLGSPASAVSVAESSTAERPVRPHRSARRSR
jgi:oligopeptide/dipeptide ABC transporter ATP-binding protein